jgi:hypothetical protein
MEPLWSPVVATGGNRSQIATPHRRQKHAKTVAVGCDQLPRRAHGKQGVCRGLPPLAGGPPGEGGVDLQALRRFSTPAAGPRPSLLHDYARSVTRARDKQIDARKKTAGRRCDAPLSTRPVRQRPNCGVGTPIPGLPLSLSRLPQDGDLGVHGRRGVDEGAGTAGPGALPGCAGRPA